MSDEGEHLIGRRRLLGVSLVAVLGQILRSGSSSATSTTAGEEAFDPRKYLAGLGEIAGAGPFSNERMRLAASTAADAYGLHDLAALYRDSAVCYGGIVAAHLQVPAGSFPLEVAEATYKDVPSSDVVAQFVTSLINSDFSVAPDLAPTSSEKASIRNWLEARKYDGKSSALALDFGEGVRLTSEGKTAFSPEDRQGLLAHSIVASLRAGYQLSFAPDGLVYLSALRDLISGGNAAIEYPNDLPFTTQALELVNLFQRGWILVGLESDGSPRFVAPGPLKTPSLSVEETCDVHFN